MLKNLFLLFALLIISFSCLNNEIIYNSTDSDVDVSLIDVFSIEDTSQDVISGPHSDCDTFDSDLICIGVAKRNISPQKYELVKRELLSNNSYCPEFDGPGNCGSIDLEKWKSLSKKWKTDFFYDCGTDRICPDDPEYVAPDADGSEGDGKFQGYWLAGYSASTPMLGINDDITVRAIVLRKASKTVAIVTMDLIGFFKSDVDRIRRLLQERAPSLGIGEVLVVSAHTHSSIDTIGMWGPQDPFGEVLWQSGADEEYIKDVVGKTLDAIVDAGVSMEIGRVRAITKRVGIEQMATDLRDPFIIDDNMSVVIFEDLKGERIATLVNWGSHPEGLAGKSNLISSDYVYYMCEAIENGISEGKNPIPASGGMAFFIQGPQGGMITDLHMDVYDDDGKKIQENSFKALKRVGENIARKVYEISMDAEYLNDTDIFNIRKEYRFPLENKFFWMMFDLGWLRDRPKWKIDPEKETYIDNVEIETEVVTKQIGDINIQSVPGELFPELAVGGYREPYDYSFGHPIIEPSNNYPPDLSKAPAGPYIRDIMKGRVKLIAGLGNDFLGYIIPEYDFKLSEDYPYFTSAAGDHYEETRSVGVKHTKIMLDNIRELYLEK